MIIQRGKITLLFAKDKLSFDYSIKKNRESKGALSKGFVLYIFVKFLCLMVAVK